MHHDKAGHMKLNFKASSLLLIGLGALCYVYNKKELMLVARKNKARIKGFRAFPDEHTIGSPCTHVVDNDNDSAEVDCSQLKIPLNLSQTSDIPMKCRPRLVYMPSFPTNGNGLTQKLLKSETLIQTFARGRGAGNVIYEIGEDFSLTSGAGQVCRDDDMQLQLPYAGQPLIMKTHHKAYKAMPYLFSGDHKDTSMAHPEQPSLLIRLARNPGDQIIRNAARWVSEGNTNGDTFFEDEGEKACDRVFKQAKAWVRFHESYIEAEKTIPSHILRYEELTDPGIVRDKILGVVDFIGEKSRGEADYSIVRKPDYVQGTLMRDICGMEIARVIHDLTRHVTMNLGYRFDEEKGTWSVVAIGNIGSNSEESGQDIAVTNSQRPGTKDQC